MKTQRTKLLPALLAAAVGFAVAAQAGEYKKTLVAPGSNFHGVHGITVAPDGMIYTGSVVGGSVYSVDPKSGVVKTVIGPPVGMADDLEFGPNGELAYTSFLTGIMHLRLPDGSIKELGTGLPGINSTAWKQDGRLFATQVFLGDALYEMDPTGAKPPRKIIEKMGGLNGFDFGPDGMLYGPLWFKGQVAKVNVDTGELAVDVKGYREAPQAGPMPWSNRQCLRYRQIARGLCLPPAASIGWRLHPDPPRCSGAPAVQVGFRLSQGSAPLTPERCADDSLVAYAVATTDRPRPE